MLFDKEAREAAQKPIDWILLGSGRVCAQDVRRSTRLLGLDARVRSKV